MARLRDAEKEKENFFPFEGVNCNRHVEKIFIWFLIILT